MQNMLQTRYYNLGEGNSVKYLVQTWSHTKSGGINLPEVHGIGKGLDANNGKPTKSFSTQIT